MRLVLRAGGALRTGPERDLVDDYLGRARGLARGLGFLDVEEHSVDLGKCRSRADETEKIVGGVPRDAAVFVLDERGKSLTSRQLSDALVRLRDEGRPSSVFLIGGADGFDPAALPSGIRKISFGSQTWPHKLVRVMLAEQIYRALTILAGTPYHRD
ncbi:23S rRNA (pseudouridine(1915)-N(3))-methyltransferase RlmH [uncultured Algimonas sp.]|uniref:23S rRNA (pseudouridine(1915)-N(3))-methyltransferase RlmH n=1 Tax=uncultured Algimonas sp. TaxID=1547920 RepID=UPI00261DBA1E|nr:23S rRNA (pseudouridine(1915)-N(3))-methyltransferase RlmH [uncultured Algimonas sp.]